ncbi:excisionase family DNA binding protein [Catenuloplanes nepalensis]|uniref:Excisionase family DNA binding protein n=2 Tax=Catenuloplanes nepalensis TaxID=587533 RepID=A0ABT9MQP1_9ACTN|nr:excisionase family DNA binding protein [Catenuloplanes nepalensis]
MSPDLLTVEDVMARLQLGKHSVYDLIRTRKLASVQIGRCRHIPARALTHYLDSLIKEAAPHGR